MKTHVLPISLIFLFILVVRAHTHEASSQEQKTFQMSPGAAISVIGDEGYIKVTSWDKNEVELTIHKRVWARSRHGAEELLKRIEIEIYQTENQLNIRQLNLHDRRHFSLWDLFDPDTWGEVNRQIVVDFDLKVPREVELRLQTDEGDVDVVNIKGDLDIHVDEGQIEIHDIQFNSINLSIDEGDIDCFHVTGEKGRMVIEADEGSLRLNQCKLRKLKIHCDEGDVSVKNSQFADLDARGDESDITIDLQPEENGQYFISTEEGDVTVHLAQDANLTLRLETSEGRIDTDFDLDITELDEGARIREKLGSGDARLEILTDEGDISLFKK